MRTEKTARTKSTGMGRIKALVARTAFLGGVLMAFLLRPAEAQVNCTGPTPVPAWALSTDGSVYDHIRQYQDFANGFLDCAERRAPLMRAEAERLNKEYYEKLRQWQHQQELLAQQERAAFEAMWSRMTPEEQLLYSQEQARQAQNSASYYGALSDVQNAIRSIATARQVQDRRLSDENANAVKRMDSWYYRQQADQGYQAAYQARARQ